ncbi:MAG: WG repeat-containing protein [Flavobacteriaceae bacterium]|nr:WG repeat-containing protein [Flavobacteriaceae bacterium]
MKNLSIFIICLMIHTFGVAQILNDIDFISPFHEDLAAIKKNNEWAFINKDGLIVIDFRNDLVSSRSEVSLHESKPGSIYYPFFKEGKCKFRKNIEGIYYYGFIDKTGKESIAPEFLNVTNFQDGYAIAMKFETRVLGSNKVLAKRMVSYKLEEYVIDTKGNLVKYIIEGRNVTPTKIGTNDIPPVFQSKMIAPHLVVIKNKNEKWDLFEF